MRRNHGEPIGFKIAERRRALGLQGAQLAKLAGTQASHLSRIENGFVFRPSDELLARIEAALADYERICQRARERVASVA